MSSVTSYDNLYGKGNRIGLISITSNIPFMAGSVNNLINGSYLNDCYFHLTNNANVGAYIKIEFPEEVLIDEITWSQSNTTLHGVWKIQGSKNGVDWEDISPCFTLGESATQIIDLQTNIKYYKFYQFTGISGHRSNSPYLYEIEFKLTSEKLTRNYLFQCGDNIMKPTMEGLELIEGTLDTQLFEEHGTDYLPDIIGQYDKEVDMVYKEDLGDKKIYGYRLVGYTDLFKLEVK